MFHEWFCRSNERQSIIYAILSANNANNAIILLAVSKNIILAW
jgi:hypothetical protein